MLQIVLQSGAHQFCLSGNIQVTFLHQFKNGDHAFLPLFLILFQRGGQCFQLQDSLMILFRRSLEGKAGIFYFLI